MFDGWKIRRKISKKYIIRSSFMKQYVTPVLRCVQLNAQDVLTTSNDVEFDVREWLGGFTQ